MHNRIRAKLFSIFFALGWLMVLAGCEESGESLQSSFSSVKVYDDTLANAENVNVHVNAGKQRLYMVYGRGSTVYSIWNLSYFQTQDEISGVVMATDLDGNLIWRNTLPEGFAYVMPVELGDGTCLVAGTNMYAYNLQTPVDKMYLFHFSRDGELIKTDSLTLPLSQFFEVSSFYHMNLLEMSGNDVLIYGTAASTDWLKYTGFSIRYSPYTGAQWTKPIDFILPADSTDNTCIYNCIRTNDGNLMFLGSFDGPSEPGNPMRTKNILIKTTMDCDIIWKRWYDHIEFNQFSNQVSPTNIIEHSNGSFYFCTNDVPTGPNGEFNVLVFKGMIYQLNQQGDSIGGATIMGLRNSYCSGILEDRNQNIVGLFNKYPDYLFNNFETYYYPFNTELFTFDQGLNLVSRDDLQTQRTDFVTSSCRLPDGRLAFFGLTTSSNHLYYRPALILKN